MQNQDIKYQNNNAGILKKQAVNLTDSQSSAVSLIRVLAITMIFSCHILQYYKIPLAYWLNVGVEMFLFISGFLFGGQYIPNWRRWFSNRARRLLPDYYITLFFALILFFCIKGVRISPTKIISYLTVTQDFFDIEVPGLGHLWYITCIWFCYLLIPFFHFLRNRVSLSKNIFFHLVILPLVLILFSYFLRLLPLRYSRDVWIFALGYLMAMLFHDNIPKYIIIFAVILASGFTLLRGLLELYSYFNSNFLILIGKGIIAPYSKVAFSFALCLVLIYVCRIGQSSIVRYIDRYSYNIYLIHVVFILGPLSFLNLYLPLPGKILLLIGLTFISAVTIKYFSDALRQRF